MSTGGGHNPFMWNVSNKMGEKIFKRVCMQEVRSARG